MAYIAVTWMQRLLGLKSEAESLTGETAVRLTREGEVGIGSVTVVIECYRFCRPSAGSLRPEPGLETVRQWSGRRGGAEANTNQGRKKQWALFRRGFAVCDIPRPFPAFLS